MPPRIELCWARYAEFVALPEVCVCYLVRPGRRGDEVLIGRKLTGLGRGKSVAPGGKLEPGETPVDAAVREVAEEVGIELSADSLELVAELTYLFPHRPQWSQKSWAFLSRSWSGNPTPSLEMEPHFHPIEALPLIDMWGDASHWLPRALRGERVAATFTFGADLETVDAIEWAVA